MTIIATDNEGKITLSLDGWLDTISAPELGEEIEKIEKAEEIVLDLDKVEYIASAGLRQVIACHKKAKSIGASFAVINVGCETMSVFSLTGLDKKLNITAK